MGTRSTYRIIELTTSKEGKIDNSEICLIYFQFDGYPSGHPSKVAKWLSEGKVVNGISMEDEGLIFNGAGCLSAQMIAEFKDGPGGVYLLPLQSRTHNFEDYLYDIIVKDYQTIEFVCYETRFEKEPIEIFRGTPQDFATKFY